MSQPRATLPDLEDPELTNRQLLVFVTKVIHEMREDQATMNNKLDTHLALHAFINRLLVVGLPVLVSIAGLAVALTRIK